jgi:hypothetical protein
MGYPPLSGGPLRVPHSLIEVHYFIKPSSMAANMAAKQDARGQAWPEVVWQGESSPEAFLREVVDTLMGFLRDDLGTREQNGETPPES